MHWFKTVATLKVGQNFGELALLQNEPRAATIFCSKDTVLATLSRFDYSTSIGK